MRAPTDLIRLMRRYDLINNKKWQRQVQWKRQNTITIEEHPQRTILRAVTFETLKTFLTIENNNLNIHTDPWIKSDRDSIRNSCNVFMNFFHLQLWLKPLYNNHVLCVYSLPLYHSGSILYLVLLDSSNHLCCHMLIKNAGTNLGDLFIFSLFTFNCFCQYW